MTKFAKIFLTAGFFLCVLFLLGISFLFMVNVPIESFLKGQAISQSHIDFIMTTIIVLWFLMSVLITVLYYHLWLKNQQQFKPFLLLVVLAAFCVTVFVVVAQNNGFVLQAFKAEVIEDGDYITIGPYPDKDYLRKLKEDGYTGVISLLNPLIPFEKILLDQELKNGKQIGLQIYSYPMLPWVSNNTDALQKIKNIVDNNKGRYYVHCYLGKHRAALVQKMLTGRTNTKAVQVNFPNRFERGELRFYQGEKIILGPYPTNEEWLAYILVSDIGLIISLLDPDDKANRALIKQEQELCEKMGLSLKFMPVKQEQNYINNVKEIASYAKNAEYKVYIHGFKDNEITTLLDVYLKGE